MSKSILKLLSAVLVLAVILISAAACSNRVDESGNDAADGVPSPESAADVPAPDSATDAPDTAGENPEADETVYDFGGREISFITWYQLEPNEEPETLQEELRLKRIKEVEEKYNVKFTYNQEVGGNEFYELLTASLLAGDPLGDIIPVQTPRYPALAYRNLLYPVSELDHIFDWSDPRWSQEMHEAGRINGKFYGVHPGSPRFGYMMFFNKEIFNRMNLPDPYELQRNNEWTWDTMLEIAQQAHMENQDGMVEIWGMTGVLDLYGWVYSNGGKVISMEGGRPVFGLTDSKAVAAMQFAQDLIHKHKVYALTPAGDPWDWPVSLFKEGKAAMMFAEQWLWQRLEDMSDDFGVLMPPMGPDADDYCSLTKVTTYFSFPAGIEDVEEVAIVLNALMDPYEEFPDKTVDFFGNIGWEGQVEHWARDSGTMESHGMIREGRQAVDFYESYPEFAAGHGRIQNPIRTGMNTAAAVVEEFANMAQAWLDDAFVD